MSRPLDSTDARGRVMVGLALAALMAATRGQQLAPLGQHLPDASLAVFLLGGFYLGRLRASSAALAGFMGLAAVIDVVAVGWGGVSAYCLTPAYGLLLAAYAAAWGAGRWYAGRHRHDRSTLPLLFATVLGVGLMAEVLASGGFYLFSGRFEPSVLGFGYSLVTYLAGTLGALFAYLGLAALAHASLRIQGLAAFRNGRR